MCDLKWNDFAMPKFGDTIRNLFSKNGSSKSTTEEVGSDSSDTLLAVRNWYEQRHDTVVVQRNILTLLLILSLVIVIVAVVAIAYVATSKSFDPFVIQIDQQTGTTEVVDPLTSKVLSGNEALDRYFIKRYVTARETYNPVDFNTYAKQVVRLLSNATVYSNYLGYISNTKTNPIILYGQGNTTYLTVRSWSKLKADTYVFRFALTETSGARTTRNKIAIINISYVAMELTEAEREINPVGFQVKGYKVDDDDS